MARTGNFLSSFILTLVCNTQFTEGTTIQEDMEIESFKKSIVENMIANSQDASPSVQGIMAQPYNQSILHKLPDELSHFLETMRNSAQEIISEIDAQVTQNSIKLTNETDSKGAAVSDFLFSASIVKETAAKVLSLVSNLLRQILLVETEKTIKLQEVKLTGQGKSLLNDWIERKTIEMKEAILNLTVHYFELTNSYKSHLNNLGVLARRLAVASTYDLWNGSAKSNEEKATNNKNKVCIEGRFMCGNGINSIVCAKYCNGFSECGDNSDEPPGCESPFSPNCGSENFRCDDGECILLRDRCGLNDPGFGCEDGTHRDYCRTMIIN